MLRNSLTTAVFLALACNSANASLIINGSFEEGVFAPPSNQTVTLNTGSSALSGWSVINDSIAWIGEGDPWQLDAQEGTKFLDLSDYSAGAPFGGVTQTIATTPGAEYQLSFYLGSSNIWGRPSVLNVWAGTTTGSFSSLTTGTLNDWDYHSLKFTAQSSNTAISFIGGAGVNYIGLDNVSVSPVPEPETYAMLIGGLAIVGAIKRKKNNV